MAAVHGPEKEGMVGSGLSGLAQRHQCHQEPAMAVSALLRPRLFLARVCRHAFRDRPACKCQCNFCVHVHQTAEAPGKEAQTYYVFSSSAVLERSCTACTSLCCMYCRTCVPRTKRGMRLGELG